MNDKEVEIQSEESLRLPPHSIEAEQSVLGGLLLDETGWDKVTGLVEEHDFYRYEHRLIFNAIKSLAEQNRPADVITVEEVLQRQELLTEAGGFPYLVDLVQNTASAINIAHYAEIVRDRSVMRQLAQVGTQIATTAYNPQGRDVKQMLDEAESMVFKIAESSGTRGEFLEMPEMLREAIEKIEYAYDRENKDDVTGIASGFVDLDKKIAGLHGGDLIIIAGRPAMGKTAFALNIAENVAINSKLPVAIFSMEMGGVQLVMRMLGSVGRLDQHLLKTGQLEDEHWGRLQEAVLKLSKAPIYIDESSSLNALDIRAKVRRLARKTKGKLGLVVIDYLQLMGGMSLAQSNNRAAELGLISRSLKALARELNVPVIALSQLSRSVEARTDKRPIMSDLRESGAIEQDADIVMFMYRDEYYHPDSVESKGLAECIIGKHRNGPTGKIPLVFMGQFSKFDNALIPEHTYFAEY